MLLVTGPVTRNMELALRKTYDATPDPKLVVAVGACGISGGIFGTNYATRGGVDQVIPVDVYIPGCPPRPEALLYGILLAVGQTARLGTGLGAGEGRRGEVPLIDPQRDVHQRDQDRHFDQRADDGGEGGAVVDAEGGDGDGDGQFEVVRRRGEGERGGLGIAARRPSCSSRTTRRTSARSKS